MREQERTGENRREQERRRATYTRSAGRAPAPGPRGSPAAMRRAVSAQQQGSSGSGLSGGGLPYQVRRPGLLVAAPPHVVVADIIDEVEDQVGLVAQHGLRRRGGWRNRRLRVRTGWTGWTGRGAGRRAGVADARPRASVDTQGAQVAGPAALTTLLGVPVGAAGGSGAVGEANASRRRRVGREVGNLTDVRLRVRVVPARVGHGLDAAILRERRCRGGGGGGGQHKDWAHHWHAFRRGIISLEG
jgi:hypothetical protein